METKIKTFLLIAALILISWAVLMYSKKNTQNNQSLAQNVASIVKNGNFSDCAKLNHVTTSNIDYQIVCQNNIALASAINNLDVSWCDKLDNKQVLIADCQSQIITAKAIKEKNINICNNLADKKSQQNCISTYKSANISLSDCDNISDSVQKAACQDFYWQTQLFKDPGKATCTNFSNSAINSDCRNMKNLLLSGSGLKPQDCAIIKSLAMNNACVLRTKFKR
jgi:hypothetical protein